ncbi:DUF4129 domain-containing protein [Microbacterium koreense]|uniref:DUF4129 domain-containing protein n=1 Tax=Microbacterium koreense TaxID=323761 RepID=A0ABW2ZTS6_9MICO
MNLLTPLIPDGDEGRRWAEDELADPSYAIAEPTAFDRVSRAIADAIARLFSSEVDGEWGLVLAVVAAAVILLVIALAFVVWGAPRSTRRAGPPAAALFGEDDERSADELRSAASARAAEEDWNAAVVLRFRALARGLVERGIVDTPPGATVHSFARTAARAFPADDDALEDAAVAFDDVRYLRRPGTADMYTRVAGVDDAVARSRPAADADTLVVAG